MHGVHVGAGSVVRNAIIDKSVEIPPGTRIGVDLEADKARGFMVEDGLTILGKGQLVED
jgi:glucose-1-phosphate adenylyltransferase